MNWLSISSWRWLLVLEGIPAVACGALTYFLLPNRPPEAEFLTPDEIDWITTELVREEEQKRERCQISAKQALANGRVWHLACIDFSALVGMYSLVFWMPLTVKSLSNRYSNSSVGCLVMIHYLMALLAMILVSRSSDRKLERRYHAAIPLTIGPQGSPKSGQRRTPENRPTMSPPLFPYRIMEELPVIRPQFPPSLGGPQGLGSGDK